MSQRELSRISGISATTIGRLYNEKWSQVDKSTMIKLCETLNVGIGDLFVYEKR